MTGYIDSKVLLYLGSKRAPPIYGSESTIPKFAAGTGNIISKLLSLTLAALNVFSVFRLQINSLHQLCQLRTVGGDVFQRIL